MSSRKWSSICCFSRTFVVSTELLNKLYIFLTKQKKTIEPNISHTNVSFSLENVFFGCGYMCMHECIDTWFEVPYTEGCWKWGHYVSSIFLRFEKKRFNYSFIAIICNIFVHYLRRRHWWKNIEQRFWHAWKHQDIKQ